jgi:hypothetical protein
LKLSEIIEEIDILTPNAIPVHIKVRWINETQKQLYRDYPVRETIHHFVTMPGEPIYALPENCQQDRIVSLYVNGKDYEFASSTDLVSGRIYTVINKKLFISPVPEKESPGALTYKPSPTELRHEEPDAIPEFPVDYHELLVIGAGIRVARSQREYDTMNALQAQYESLSIEANRNITKPKLKNTRVMRRWN